MLLTVKELITVLRQSVNVQYDTDEVIDSAYLSMSDDDLMLCIKIGISGAYPDVDDIEDLPNGSEYPVVLLAKIELYTRLAVARVDKVDLVADNNNQLKQSQRFEHYMDLIAEAKEEYQNWVDNEMNSKVDSFNTILNRRRYDIRNYNIAPTPKVNLKIVDVTNNSVCIKWAVTNSINFGRYKVYISKVPIFDPYAKGEKLDDRVNENAIQVKSTMDIRNCYHRVEGLEPNTTYFILVVSVERTQVFGYSEKSFTTLEEFIEEEESETTDITDITTDDIGGEN